MGVRIVFGFRKIPLKKLSKMTFGYTQSESNYVGIWTLYKMNHEKLTEVEKYENSRISKRSFIQGKSISLYFSKNVVGRNMMMQIFIK